MMLSKGLIAHLQKLIAGDTVAASLLRKDIASELQEEGLLTVRTNGSRRAFAAIDCGALKRFLEARYEEFRGYYALCGDDVSRAAQAALTGNSKLVTVRSCPGFMVNSYEPIPCKLNGADFVVNPPEGCMVFVADWERFEIPEDVIVVGIENMENFRKIQQQKEFFEREINRLVYLEAASTENAPLRLFFVSRYPQSADLRKWLSRIPNRYIHFGDVDLAGVNIFLTEFYQYIGDKASFLIPTDIEERLQNGSTERYNKQYASFKELHSNVTEVQSLIDLINKYRRGYDQEGYIEKA